MAAAAQQVNLYQTGICVEDLALLLQVALPAVAGLVDWAEQLDGGYHLAGGQVDDLNERLPVLAGQLRDEVRLVGNLGDDGLRRGLRARPANDGDVGVIILARLDEVDALFDAGVVAGPDLLL